MKKINLEIQIHASIEKVWNTVIDDSSYRDWTSAFSPGSFFKGNWTKGSKMYFLGPDPNTGEEGGMVSEIAENMQHKFISIKHIGFIRNNIEDTTSDEVKKWTPSFENYSFAQKGDGMLFTVNQDLPDDFHEYFLQAWPKALTRIKELAENK